MTDYTTTLKTIDEMGIERDQRGRITSRIGATLSLYFLNGDQEDIRISLNNIIEEYCRIFEEQITHVNTGDSRKLKKVSLDEILELLKNLPLKQSDKDFYFKGQKYSTSEREDPSLYSVVAFAFGKKSFRPLSGVKMHFPAQFLFQDLNRFCTLIAHWSGKIHAHHGTAGLGVLTMQGDEIHNPLHYRFLRKFPGLDFDAMGSFWARTAGKGSDHVRASNWLTILSSHFIQRLGGLEFIEKRIGCDGACLNYDGGVVIRACDAPVLGDAPDFVPDGYKNVARLVKDIRFEDYQFGVINVPSNVDGLEATLRWLRRFD